MSSELDAADNDWVMAELVPQVADAYRPPNITVEETVVAIPANKPRIWTALVVGILSVPMSIFASYLVMAFAGDFYSQMGWVTYPVTQESWTKDFFGSHLGLFLSFLPGEMVFLIAAFASASFSPVGIWERLRLGRGRLPLWTWMRLAIATPAFSELISMFMYFVVGDRGEHLEQMSSICRSQQGIFVVVLFLLVAVMPGLCEEALFRGYLQSRLLQRMPPLIAITITSLIFAVAHFNPMHILAVLPAGIWLGVIAWRSDSIWPSAVCHMANNAAYVVMTLMSDSTSEVFDADLSTLITMILCLVATMVGIVILIKYGGKQPESIAPITGADATLPV